MGLNNPSGLSGINIYNYVFKYGARGHPWAAILDLKAKMI